MEAITLGIQFAVTILLLVVAGYYLDDYLGTTPLFIIIFLFLGFAAALYHLIKDVDRMKNRTKSDKEDENGD